MQKKKKEKKGEKEKKTKNKQKRNGHGKHGEKKGKTLKYQQVLLSCLRNKTKARQKINENNRERKVKAER